MNRRLIINLISASVVLAIIITPIFFLCVREDEQYKKDRELIGSKVVLYKDTLVIIDYHNQLNKGRYILSNRAEIMSDDISKFIIQ